MYIKNKRGQSTVEYVLLVTAVLAVLIAFFSNAGGGNGFSNQLNTALNTATSDIGTAATTISASHAPGAQSNSTVTTPYTVDVTNGV